MIRCITSSLVVYSQSSASRRVSTALDSSSCKEIRTSLCVVLVKLSRSFYTGSFLADVLVGGIMFMKSSENNSLYLLQEYSAFVLARI